MGRKTMRINVEDEQKGNRVKMAIKRIGIGWNRNVQIEEFNYTG